MVAFVLVAAAGGILASGIAIPFAASASATTDEALRLFNEVPDDIKPGTLSQASTVYAANGQPLATFYSQNRIVVPLSQVSPAMQHAVIAVEDERFYEHGGVDPRGILRAVVNNLEGHDQQGASTLTQQYVKNVLLDQAQQAGDPFGMIEAREDSLARKAREMKLAIALEKQMPKNKILEGYLNVAQFGANNIYGVETAARYFFNKSAKDLTPVEAATIAGITNSPNKFDPTVKDAKGNPNYDEATKRRNIVLNKMWAQGYITTDEYNKAKATKIQDTLHITPVPTGCAAAGGAAFFCDYVIKEIISSPEFGKTQNDRAALLYRGGLKITTTLDVGKQAAAEARVTSEVPVGNTAGLAAALASVEPRTGKILAMAQNVPYDASANPAPGTTSINYAADFAHGGSRGFQPGSGFKPFALADYLEEGHTLNNMVSGTKVKWHSNNFHSSCGRIIIDSKGWGPANSEGNLSGPITVDKALYDSVNTAFADMATQMDLCRVAQTAYDAGFRPTISVSGKPLTSPQMSDIFVTPTMVIGTQNTSPLDMAAAYATFASNGTYCTPVAITKVVGANGKEMPVPQTQCNPNAMPANVAATVVSSMQKVLTQGTAAGDSLANGRPAAGKTGTNQLAAQTWFNGFTPDLSTSVWVGDPRGEADHRDIWFQGQHLTPLFGSSIAAPLWRDYMNDATANMPMTGFPAPDPALVGAPAAPPPAAPAQGGQNGQQAPPQNGGPFTFGPGAGNTPGGGGPGGGGPGGGNGH